MTAKILVFVICGEGVIYQLLYNLRDSTFNGLVKMFVGIFKENSYFTQSQINGIFLDLQDFSVKLMDFSEILCQDRQLKGSKSDFVFLLLRAKLIFPKGFYLDIVLYKIDVFHISCCNASFSIQFQSKSRLFTVILFFLICILRHLFQIVGQLHLLSLYFIMF